MFMSKKVLATVAMLFALLPAEVLSQEAAEHGGGSWAVVLGIQADDQDARGVFAGLTYAVTESTWINAGGGFTRVTAAPGEKVLDSRLLSLGVDHRHERVGVEINADYWGDPGELTRKSVSGGFYYATDISRVSLSGIYRDYTLTARILDDQGILTNQREFGMTGTGVATGLRLNGERWFGGLKGGWYNYSRDPAIFSSRRAFDLLSVSALTLSNSFLDYQLQANLGFNWGLKSLELESGSSRSAVDGADILTMGLIFVTPLAEATDIELSAGINDAQGEEQVVFASIALTWYSR